MQNQTNMTKSGCQRFSVLAPTRAEGQFTIRKCSGSRMPPQSLAFRKSVFTLMNACLGDVQMAYQEIWREQPRHVAMVRPTPDP
jgi:hypothetical protein